MDVFKFQGYLRNLLSGRQDDEVIRIMHDSTLKSLGHSRDVESVAEALIDTAHTLLFTSEDKRGVELFVGMLEQRIGEARKAKAQTLIPKATAKINND